MSVQLEQTYISVGANRSSSCSASTSSGLLAYGAGPLVALWNADPSSSRGCHATLPGHTGVVTTVKLLQDENANDNGAAFISGDSSGNVRIWKREPRGEMLCAMSLDAHPQSSISALAVCPPGPLDGHILTGASDGTFKLWQLEGLKPKLVQTVDLKGKLPLDMEVARLPGSTASVLILGCTDRRIQIYTLRDNLFEFAFSLEGHEDWVRCLAVTPYPSSSGLSDDPDILIASGSQDNYVRLWRISPLSQELDQVKGSSSEGSGQSSGPSGNGLDMLDEFERKLAGEAGNGGSMQISTKAHVLAVESGQTSQRFNVTLEALLIGHEGGLTNVHWSSPTPSSTPHLLSTASDNSIMIWTPSSPESTDGIWIPAHRFGAMGGRGLSFFGAVWGKDARSVLASGWNGGWERWVRMEEDGEDGNWEPKVGLMGHWEDVRGVEWSPDGAYLLSVSSDQTTRVHASTSTSTNGQSRWAEIARPQIHGYDLTCAAWLSPYRFSSGADEKVTRVFDAPRGFVESLGSLGVRDLTEIDIGDRPKGATVPPLGLSNRALGRAVDATIIPTSHHAQDFVSRAMTALPTEEELATSTLWPEIEKVYGHGYELVSMAASHSGKLLATSCRATTAEHAAVRLVSTSTWDTTSILSGHSLTVTRIQFSPDDKYVLTCSRDRGWRVFGRKNEESEEYELVAGDERAHARMVLDACWLKGKSGGFATAGRDKSVKIWAPATVDGESTWTLASTIKLDEGACAVDSITTSGGKKILAIGTESGRIWLYELNLSQSGEMKDKLILKLDDSICHVQAVSRLAFRPGKRDAVELASGSDDRSVRIFSIKMS